jgi:hypothetical protein
MARSVMMEVMEQEAVQVMNRFRKVLVLRHKQHNPQIMPKETARQSATKVGADDSSECSARSMPMRGGQEHVDTTWGALARHMWRRRVRVCFAAGTDTHGEIRGTRN